MAYELARVVAEQVAELLPEMAKSDDVQAHIEDSIESGELTDPWLDPCYNPFQGMSEDEKRAARYWMFESAAA